MVDGPSGLSSLSRMIREGSQKKQKKLQKPQTPNTYFPEVSHKAVAYWLLASAASVFGIVVFGGLTRLTESGYGLFTVLTQPPITDLTKSEYY